MTRSLAVWALGLLILSPSLTNRMSGQSLGNAGTIGGVATDPSGAAVPNAVVTLHNPVTNYNQSTITDASGAFRLVNIPPNPYHLEIKAANFDVFSQEVTIRGALPVEIKAKIGRAHV